MQPRQVRGLVAAVRVLPVPALPRPASAPRMRIRTRVLIAVTSAQRPAGGRQPTCGGKSTSWWGRSLPGPALRTPRFTLSCAEPSLGRPRRPPMWKYWVAAATICSACCRAVSSADGSSAQGVASALIAPIKASSPDIANRYQPICALTSSGPKPPAACRFRSTHQMAAPTEAMDSNSATAPNG